MGVCIICGKKEEKCNRYIKQMCYACYKKQYYLRNNPPKYQNKQCLQCGAEFIDKTQSHSKMYCCKQCRYDSHKRSLTKKCPNCNATIVVFNNQIKYCNERCRREHYRGNIEKRLAHNLRTRLHTRIAREYKTDSAVKDLGCTIDELKIYLESKFIKGMNWDNYGVKGWHIDHIKPLSKFNLINSKEFLKACHYTNLQPLWAKDNLSKGNKYDGS